jgi:hypothetical protein
LAASSSSSTSLFEQLYGMFNCACCFCQSLTYVCFCVCVCLCHQTLALHSYRFARSRVHTRPRFDCPLKPSNGDDSNIQTQQNVRQDLLKKS